MRRGHGGGHAAASRPRGDGFVADLEYNPDLIPQTRALKEYRLNPNDLKPLKVTRTTNPRDPSYAPMKLYNIWDLKRVCDAKYAKDGGLDAFKQKKAARSAEIDADKLQKDMGKATRAGELVTLLVAAGVPEAERAPLLASELAVKFIKRAKSKATAAQVASQLLTTRDVKSGAAAAPAPVMATPAKAAPPRAPAASPASGVKLEMCAAS